jgi:hypothetical protein
MPSHKIHLTIASEVNKNLKLDNDSIMLGSVLPDLTITKDHGKSHYQVDSSYEEQLANPDKFIAEYKSELDNPIMMGYLIHILTDRYYNDYFFKNHCLFNDKGYAEKVILKNGRNGYPIKKYKQSEFGKYDKYLLKKHLVAKFNNTDCVSQVKDLSIAQFDIEYLKKYVVNANKEIDNPRLYKINSCFFYRVLSKKELDEMLNNCCKYIVDYISSTN